MFTDAVTLVGSDNARTDVEVLIEYAKSLGTINATVEGRITVIR